MKLFYWDFHTVISFLVNSPLLSPGIQTRNANDELEHVQDLDAIDAFAPIGSGCSECNL